MSSAHIERVSIKVTGLGDDIYPIAFDLRLGVNTIPSITIELLPTDGAEGVGTYVKATTPSFDDLTKLYSSLLTKAETQVTKASVTIKTIPDVSRSGFCKPQTLTLTDWTLTDVSLSDVTTAQAPKLVIALSHPAEVLDRTGYIYELIDSETTLNRVLANEVSGSTLIEIMTNVYELVWTGGKLKFKDLIPPLYGGPPDDMKQIIKNYRQVGLSVGRPSGFLDDKSGGLFLQNDFGDDLQQRLTAALAYITLPTPFCASTFRRLVSNILPSLGLVIVPTYDKPRLEVRPFAPWVNASEALGNGSVTSMSMSPQDPDPLIGTAMCLDVHDIDPVVGDATRVSKNERNMNVLFYVPDKAKNNYRLLLGESSGIIEDIGDSEIITTMESIDLGSKKTIGAGSKELQDTENLIESADLLEPRKKYLEETFIENYRRGCTASVNAVLSFYDITGQLLYPGRVFTVVEEGGTHRRLIYGYVTEILSRGSTVGDCTTTIQMTHVRPSKDQQAELLVEQPTPNKFYPANASI